MCCQLRSGRSSMRPGVPVVGEMCRHWLFRRPSTRLGGPAVGDMCCHLHLGRPSSRPGGPAVGNSCRQLHLGRPSSSQGQLSVICLAIVIRAALETSWSPSVLDMVCGTWDSRSSSRRSRRTRRREQEKDKIEQLQSEKWGTMLLYQIRTCIA